MGKNYILFIHGVNTREEREERSYANELIKKIKRETGITEKYIKALYWGDVNIQAEEYLKRTLSTSPYWSNLWFRSFREKQLLQFIGDAALYISRHMGAKIVQRLKNDAVSFLKDCTPDDKLHLVTHSWGTVILFDLLFAPRWDRVDTPGHKDVMDLRDIIYGVSGSSEYSKYQGIQLSSIHTMGSPIALFSLIDVVPGKDSTVTSGHDITPRLQELLDYLHKENSTHLLLWRNYIHPGDPIAYPLNELLNRLVNGKKKYLDVQDVITYKVGKYDLINKLINQTVLALLQGGAAHGSYWSSSVVADCISNTISSTAI